MRLYLDTAETDQWDALMPLGIFHGITTNPLLAARAGHAYPDIDWRSLVARARDLGAHELHAQVYGAPEGYHAWAERFLDAGAAAGIRVVVKVPLVPEAIRMVPSLRKMGAPILMTACYRSSQAMIATGLGAEFLAPYLGRMRDQGIDDIAELRAMVALTEGSGCSVLAASIRGADHLSAVAATGCPMATIGPDVARGLVEVAPTRTAYEDFETAARP